MRFGGCTRFTLSFAAFLLTGQAAAAQAAPIPMPERWDTTYVLLFEMNPSYVAPSDSAAGSVLMAHIQYQLGLLADGRARQGGPIADATPSEMIGMTVLTTGSRKEADAIAAADPAVAAGRFQARVRAWTTPAAKAR
jgi:uncharacterized protein YciI